MVEQNLSIEEVAMESKQAMEATQTVGTTRSATRLMTVPELAALWSCSPSYIYKIAATGELRTVRLGRALRIRPADAEAVLAREE
jgi:excisionase family DNA binding protein